MSFHFDSATKIKGRMPIKMASYDGCDKNGSKRVIKIRIESVVKIVLANVGQCRSDG